MSIYLDENKSLWENYKNWIVWHELKMPDKTRNKLFDLIDLLHNYDFRPPTDKDKYRAEDGLEMRVMYLEHFKYDDVYFHHNPKVLEVLAALAQRMELEYVGDPMDPEPYTIFLDILKNLGIGSKHSEHTIKKTLNHWMDGEFPLFITDKKPVNDDIWSQMQMYIHENYS